MKKQNHPFIRSHLSLIFIILMLVFLVEIAVMLFLYKEPYHAILDASLLVIIVAPFLAFMVIKYMQLTDSLSDEVRFNAAMADISTALISQASLETISVLVLEHAKRLTGSKFGYVGYIDPQTGYLVSPTLTRDIWSLCSVKDKNFIFKKFTGLFGWVLNNREPLLTNTPADDSRSSGTPAGHIPIHRFLSAPALMSETLFGQVAVANSDRDYTENDLEIVERLATLYAIAIQHMRAEEMLQKSEARLQLQIDRMPIGCIVWDSELRIVSWNPAAEEIFGYKAGEAIGKHPYDIIVPKDAQPHVDIIWKRLLEGDATAHSVNENITKDGRTIICSWSNTPLKETDGTIIGVLSMVQDITEHRQAEEALAQSEEKYRSLIENIPDVVWISDQEGNTQFISPVVEKIYGYTPEEIYNDSELWFIRIHPDDVQRVIKTYEAIFSENRMFDIEYRIQRKDGNWIWLHDRALTTYEKNGKSYVIGIFSDITWRKEAENALQDSEAKYRMLFESSSDAIMMLDEKGFFDCNYATLLLFGFLKKEDFIKVHPAEVSPPFQPDGVDSLTAANNKIAEAFRNGTNMFEWVHRRKNGEDFPASVLLTAFQYKGKQVLQATVRDITESKKADEQIKASLEEKEVLLREVYHRVKNNMQIISSMLKLQSRHIKEERYREIFKECQNRIMAMSLVHEKLYQSRDLAKIDFENYIRDITKSLLQSYRAATGNIALNIDVEKISLRIDYAVPCGLIINELVSNSLKHAFPDRIEGEIKISLHVTDENTIELTVSDNGVGIPENLDFRSTGSLGLHLVTMLAENQLHGEIDLNRSRGTEFKIKFKEVKK